MAAAGSAEESVARAVARALCSAGIQRVYGLPGEDHLRLLDALASEDVAYISARDETAAAIMAATEAQASGLPGVVVVTIAPGLTNAINGIAHAHLDGIPLLVISGQHHPERAPLIVRQGMDNHQLVAGVTKWRVTASARIHQVLARALETALAPPAGPVLFELRDDIASMAAADRAADWPLLQTGALEARARVTRVAVPRPVLERVAGARRPVIIVGGGCPTDPATRAALAHAACCLRAPVFTTPATMGVISSDEAWFAGTFMNGNFEARMLGEADLILTLGLDAKDFFNAAWRYSAAAIGVNERADTQRFAPLQHQLVGDTRALLRALAEAVSKSASAVAPALGSACTWSTDDVVAYRQHVAAPFGVSDGGERTVTRAEGSVTHGDRTVTRAASSVTANEASVTSDAAPVTTAAKTVTMVENTVTTVENTVTPGGDLTIPSALRVARAVLPPDTLVAVDAGFGKPLTAYLWSARAPNQYFTAHGLSTMGYALPAANALQLARPDRPVVAFMGDGSLLMRASEITVAVEQGIAPIYIAWMDGALAQIETKQLRQGLRPVGARLPPIACAKVAEAFGAVGCDVATLAAFRAALEEALRRRGPTLIGARVDQSRRAEWYDLLRG